MAEESKDGEAGVESVKAAISSSEEESVSSEEALEEEHSDADNTLARPMIAVEIRKSRRDQENLTEEWYHQSNYPPLRMSAS